MNTFCLKHKIKLRWQCLDASDIIVDQAHQNAFLCLLFQNIYDRIKHFALFNNKVFQENKMSGTL